MPSLYNDPKNLLALEWLRRKQQERERAVEQKFISALEKLASPVRKGIAYGVLQGVLVAFICWAVATLYTDVTTKRYDAERRLERSLHFLHEGYLTENFLSSLSGDERLPQIEAELKTLFVHLRYTLELRGDTSTSNFLTPEYWVGRGS